MSGVANYHYKVTDDTTGTVIQESDVDGAKTSVQFPSLPGKTYKCSVTATNACAATSKAGEATQTCQVITPTPTPAITVTPTPTLTGCPTPGTVKNLRMTCPNCPAQ